MLIQYRHQLTLNENEINVWCVCVCVCVVVFVLYANLISQMTAHDDAT
jgi:hypothetical protein